MMKHLLLLAGIVTAAVCATAAPVRADVTGPRAFYFGATCTGIGDVILTNVGPSHTAALQVLGSTTVVLVPDTHSPGVPGLESQAAAAGTTCTFTAGGDSPDQLEPFGPLTLPVVIT